MKFALPSFAPLNTLVLAGLLAAGASAMAQPAPVAPATGPATSATAPAQRGAHMGRHDPAKMQAWMAKRQAEMKATLKITPAQEGAWTAYTAAMQPPAGMMGRGGMAGSAGMGMGARPTPEQRAEFDKLTTPQRIDKMRALRTQRMTEMSALMDKRGEATKTFYAALSPEQQKTFDAEQLKRGGRGAHAGRGGFGGHDGHHGGHHQRS